VKNSFVYFILVLLLSFFGCSDEGTESITNQAAEKRIDELKSDFVVEPAISRILTDKTSYRWNQDFSAQNEDSAKFTIRGGEAPFKIEVIEGQGTFNEDDLSFESTDYSGLVVLKFTDNQGRTGHAVIEVAKPISLDIQSKSISPCQRVKVTGKGGFPPYRMSTTQSASIIEKSLIKAPNDSSEFSVMIEDSQGNRKTVKLSAQKPWNDTVNFCFGENGKIRFPETNNPLDRNKERNFLSFVPSSTVNVQSSGLIVAGTKIEDNDFIGIGFHKESGSFFGDSIEHYKTKYKLSIEVRAYNSKGLPDLTFATNGVFNYQSVEKEITKADTVTVLKDGKILISGVSFRDDGVRLILIKLTANGSLDNSFGSNGVVESEIYSSLPRKFASGLFGVGFQDRPLQVKKVLEQDTNSGSQIVVLLDSLQDPGNIGRFKNVSEVLAYSIDGNVINDFGNKGVISTVNDDYSFNSIESIATDSDGNLLTLQSSTYEVIAQIKKYDKNGVIKNTFGEEGVLEVKDPYWGKRPYDSGNSNDDEGIITHSITSGDLFDNVKIKGIAAGPEASIALVGQTELYEDSGEESSRRTAICILEKEKDGKYIAKWKTGKNRNSYIVGVSSYAFGDITSSESNSRYTSEYWSQKIVLGTWLYSPSSSGHSFGISRTGLDYNQYVSRHLSIRSTNHSIMAGDKNEVIRELSLLEGSPEGQERDKVSVLTDGGLYQFLVR
jgi:hypothetical protein